MDLRLRALISHYYRVQPAIETNTATEVAGHQHGRHIPQSKVAAGQARKRLYESARRPSGATLRDYGFDGFPNPSIPEIKLFYRAPHPSGTSGTIRWISPNL
jgi:hypothetical protein